MGLLKRVWWCLVFPVALVACAAGGGQTGHKVDIAAGHLEIAERPVLARHHGAVDLLYFNAKNELMLRPVSGTESLLGNDGAGANARRAYAMLHTDGDALYAVWWSKIAKEVEGIGKPGQKLVYARVSQDRGKTFGPAQRLNDGGGAFIPGVASSGLGDVYVMYTDERSGGKELGIYMNVSHDHGVTWKAKDIQINSTESIGMSLNPIMVADGERIYVAWMTRGVDNQFKLFVRQSNDRGEHWLDPVSALSSSRQPDAHKLVKIGNTLLLCWLDTGEVSCNRSTDQNQSWSESFAIENSTGAEGLLMETDPKGRVHLLVGKKPEGDMSRVNLFHAVAENAAEFSSLQRISGGTPHAASTILPVMAFGDDGSILVSWVDMRYARPVIAANYSKDGGVTWLPENVVLAGKKGQYHFFPTVAYAGNGIYRLAWQETSNRTEPTSVIGQREFVPGSPSVSMPRPDMERLKQRVNEFWNLRTEDKYEQIYDYMDPFFREANTRKGYIRSQGLVKYYSHRITAEPTLNGITASVPLAYASEVPEVFLQGKKVAVPKQEVEISHEWIWVDGDWFQVFRDFKNGSFLPQ